MKIKDKLHASFKLCMTIDIYDVEFICEITIITSMYIDKLGKSIP